MYYLVLWAFERQWQNGNYKGWWWRGRLRLAPSRCSAVPTCMREGGKLPPWGWQQLQDNSYCWDHSMVRLAMQCGLYNIAKCNALAHAARPMPQTMSGEACAEALLAPVKYQERCAKGEERGIWGQIRGQWLDWARKGWMCQKSLPVLSPGPFSFFSSDLCQL